jgi:hypothetical protein
VRFRRNAFSPISPPNSTYTDLDWDAKTPLGLGIAETPFKPDTSPVTPGTIESIAGDRAEALGAPSNFAQRIEQKLWNFTGSGNIIKRWLIEIISWAFSAACMAGIAIVLFIYRNKRNPNLPLGITLNAYISVLAKFASAGLLLPVSEALGQLKWSWFNRSSSKKMWDFEIFDSASRGPWGSLLLLVRTKGRTLAALGAAVTIFALALDPFFQQVARFPEEWREQTGEGHLSIARTYEPQTWGKEWRNISGEMLAYDQAIMAVAYDFFFEDGTLPRPLREGVIPEVPLSCPNSRCEWKNYTTLAVCNRCESVTDQLEFKCASGTLDWVQVPDKNEPHDEVNYPNGTACGWWLKADVPVLMAGYKVDTDSAVKANSRPETLLMRAHPLYDVMTKAPVTGYNAKLNDTRNPLLHGVLVSGISMENVLRNGTPIAHECILSWCVQEMWSQYENGGYKEGVNQSYYNHTVEGSPWYTEKVFDDDGDFMGVYYDYMENVVIETPAGEIWEVSNQSHMIALSVFDDVYPSTLTFLEDSPEYPDQPRLRYKQYVTKDVWYRTLDNNLLMSDNLDKHFDNMATALTNSIRSADHTTDIVRGRSYELESFVEVRWCWLILPVGLLALTFLFLAGTIIRSSMEKESIGVYKSSAIATLLFGLPDEMQKKIISSKAQGTPRANAKETKVKWTPNTGWRFSGNSLSPNSTKPRDSSVLQPRQR